MAWLNRVKDLFVKDKEVVVSKEARGVGSGAPGPNVGSPAGYDAGTKHLMGMLEMNQDLMHRYADYEDMDDYPETIVALDQFTDDSTIPDSIHNKTIWATSPDRVVRDILDDCLTRRLRIEEDVWSAVRTLAKYGNLYSENLVNEIGVIGLNWLPVPTMRRVVNEKGLLLGFVQDLTGQFNYDKNTVNQAMTKAVLPSVEEKHKGTLIFFHPWQVTHWRLRSKNMWSQYGYSLLDSGRWIFKRLKLLEDQALVNKLLRSPSRYAFYVDTGDLPPREAMALVRKVKRGYKKKTFVDPRTGKLDFKANVLSPTEDFWVPTKGGKESTRIEVISGPDVQMMDDVDYFHKKLLLAIRMPDTQREGQPSGAAMSQEDVKVARICMRLQREFIQGLKAVLRLHLAALNIDPDSVKWDLRMTVPSAIFEMQQIEVLNAQASLAGAMADFADKQWILEHIFHFTEDDASTVVRSKEDEVDSTMKKEASTQAEIQKMYPELQELPQPPGEEPLPPQESIKEIKGLVKVLKESNSGNAVLSKRFDSIDNRLIALERVIKRNALNN